MRDLEVTPADDASLTVGEVDARREPAEVAVHDVGPLGAAQLVARLAEHEDDVTDLAERHRRAQCDVVVRACSPRLSRPRTARHLEQLRHTRAQPRLTPTKRTNWRTKTNGTTMGMGQGA